MLLPAPVRAALTQQFGNRVSVRGFPPGLAGQEAAVVGYDSGEVFVKWVPNGDKSQAARATLAREARNLRHVSSPHVPRLLTYLPDPAVLVVAAVPGATPVTWTQQSLAAAAAALKSLTAAPGAMFEPWRETFMATSENRRRRLHRHFGSLDHPTAQSWLAANAEVLTWEADTLSHTDCHPRNWLANPDGLWLVDLDHARWAPAGVDFALLATFTDGPVADRVAFAVRHCGRDRAKTLIAAVAGLDAGRDLNSLPGPLADALRRQAAARDAIWKVVCHW